LLCKSLLNVIISQACKEVVEKIVVAKPVTKNKFVQIRGKKRAAGAKLSFRLTRGAHPSVLNALSVNFSIIKIYKVMLVHTNRMFINAIVNSVNVGIRAPPVRYNM